LPQKWTHAKFFQELVFDLLLLEQSKKHVRFLESSENNSMASLVAQS
jgi:hypothetical protein